MPVKVKVTRPFGRFREVGAVVDLPHRQARTLALTGRVSYDIESAKPKRGYKRRDMVAEPPVEGPVVVPTEPAKVLPQPDIDPTDA